MRMLVQQDWQNPAVLRWPWLNSLWKKVSVWVTPSSHHVCLKLEHSSPTDAHKMCQPSLDEEGSG